MKESIMEIISHRHSWRDYSEKRVEAEKLDRLREVFAQVEPAFGNKPVFRLVEFDDINSLTTYGFIKGARLFIAGKITSSKMQWEDYGWSLESVILHATDMGLATCWLGGTFSSSAFAGKMDLGPEESIPAVSPIGYATDKRSLRDKAIRKIAGSHKRKAWQALFFQDQFGSPLPEDDEYGKALAMLRLAPSASNRQPWRVVKRETAFHFYIKRTAGYSKFTGSDLQRIDMGIAMVHFDLMLKDAGIQGKWVLDDPRLHTPKGVEYRVTWKKA